MVECEDGRKSDKSSSMTINLSQPSLSQETVFFIHMPGAKRGKAHKFARTFHGPYRVLEVVENGILARRVDRPKEDMTRVALNRVRRCPLQIADESWPQCRGREHKQSAVAPQQTPAPSV